MTKPKLTNAQSRERAIKAHRLPEGTIGRQYQVVLTVTAAEWFQGLSSKGRGAIVEAGMISTIGGSIVGSLPRYGDTAQTDADRSKRYRDRKKAAKNDDRTKGDTK